MAARSAPKPNLTRARSLFRNYLALRAVFDAGHRSENFEAAMFELWSEWIDLAWTLPDAEVARIENEVRAERASRPSGCDA
jgi:hypothetical protein